MQLTACCIAAAVAALAKCAFVGGLGQLKGMRCPHATPMAMGPSMQAGSLQRCARGCARELRLKRCAPCACRSSWGWACACVAVEWFVKGYHFATFRQPLCQRALAVISRNLSVNTALPNDTWNGYIASTISTPVPFRTLAFALVGRPTISIVLWAWGCGSRSCSTSSATKRHAYWCWALTMQVLTRLGGCTLPACAAHKRVATASWR